MMRGVMKKISSWLVVLTVVCLNRLPSHGMLPSSGTWANVDGVVGLDDAADHHRSTIGHQTPAWWLAA